MYKLWIMLAAALVAVSILALERGFLATGMAGLWLTCLPIIFAVMAFETRQGNKTAA